MKTRTVFLGLIGAAGMLMAVGSARAISYSLSTGNSAISGYTGPYGTVDVSLTDSTHATITFTGDTVNGYQFLFGGAGAVDVNVNATSFTLGTVTGTPGTAGPFNGGSGNISQFGSFNQTISSFDGFTHAATSVTFNLTDNSGTWASDSVVLTPNVGGSSVAAHIFVLNTANGSNPATGYAANGNEVPDGGSTALLLGAALSAFVLIRRKLG